MTDPCFFGSAESQLFGVLHAPEEARAHQRGVVLCSPMGHEYVNTRRACGQLAARLARVGFPTFRFDYYGTGDSAGEGDEIDFARWTRDTEAAIDELRVRSGVVTVSLFGIRLGGSVAVAVAGRRPDVTGLALWEPVVRGSEYLAELQSSHASFLESEAKEGRSVGELSRNEIHGFPLPPRFAIDLDGLNLLDVGEWPPKVLILGDGDGGLDELAARAGESATVERRRFPGRRIWIRQPGEERALVPTDVLQAVVSWVSETPGEGFRHSTG